MFDEDDGLRVRSVDSNQVALASLALMPSALSPYRCSEQVILGIQLDALSVILKSCAVDDMIKLEYRLNSRVSNVMSEMVNE